MELSYGRGAGLQVRGDAVELGTVTTGAEESNASIQESVTNQSFWHRDIQWNVTVPRGNTGPSRITPGTVTMLPSANLEDSGITNVGNATDFELDFRIPCDDLVFEPGVALVYAESGRPGGVSSVSAAEIARVANASSDVQETLDAKQPVVTGAASSVMGDLLDASRIVVTDASGKLAGSNIAGETLWYLDGLRTSVQTQLQSKQGGIAGAGSTVASANCAEDVVLLTDPSGKIGASTLPSTALDNLRNLRTNVQSGINGALPRITGAASSAVSDPFAASRAVTSNVAGKLASSNVTAAELLTLQGLRGNVAGQLAGKQRVITGSASSATVDDFVASRALVTDPDGMLGVSNIASEGLVHIRTLTGNLEASLSLSRVPTITGAASSITRTNLPADIVVVSDASGKLAASSTAVQDLLTLRGMEGYDVQSELDLLQDRVTGALTSAAQSNFSAHRVVATDASGKLQASSESSTTDVLRLANAASNLQTQLDAKQPAITGAISTALLANLQPHVFVVSDAQGRLTQSNVDANIAWFLAGLAGNVQSRVNAMQPNITGAATTVTDDDLDPDVVVVTDASGKLAGSNVSTQTAWYLDGLSSNVQAQLDTKQTLLTGAATTVLTSDLEVDTILVSDDQGKVANSNIASSALWYLSGTRGDIAEQLAAKQGTVTGAASTATLTTFDADRALVTNVSGKLAASNVASEYIEHLLGLDSNLQAQLDDREDAVTGAASTATAGNFSASKVVASNALGKLAVAANASYEKLWYLDGIVGNIQGRLDDLQPTITGAPSSILVSDTAGSRALASDTLGKIAPSSLASETLWYLDGLPEANVQESLGTFQPDITGAARSFVGVTVSPSTLIVSDSTGALATSGIAQSYVHYLDGVTTSNVQGSLNGKAHIFSGSLASVADEDLEPTRVVISDATGNIAASNISVAAVEFARGLGSPLQAQLDAKQASITGSSVANILVDDVEGSKVLVTDAEGNIAASSLGAEQLWTLSGLRSNAQAQLDSKQDVVTGALSSVVTANATGSKAMISTPAGKIANSTVSSSAISYLGTVTSNVEIQLSSKQPTVTGAATTALTANMPLSMVLTTSASGKLANSSLAAQQLWYLDGTEIDIQSQLDSKQAAITGAASSIATANLAADKVAIADTSGKLANSNVVYEALWYIDGLTGNLQSELDSKQPVVTGGMSSVLAADLSPARIAVTDDAGKMSNSNVASLYVQYLDGATSSIQGQLDGKQAIVPDSTATSVMTADLAGGKILVTDADGYVSNSNIDSDNLWYLQGITSSIQTQINSKQATIDGSAVSIVSTTLQGSRVLVSNDSDGIAASNVSSSDLWCLDGTTGNLQAQLDELPTAYTGAIAPASTSNAPASKLMVTDANGQVSNSNVSSASLWYLDGSRSNIALQLASKQAALTGAFSNATVSYLTSDVVLVSNSTGKIIGSNVATAAFGRISGATGNIQAQLDSKLPLLTPSSSLSITSLTAQSGLFGGLTTTDRMTLFGDGSDGNWGPGFGAQVVTRDMYLGNVTLQSGDTINTNGWRLFVRGNLNFTNASANCVGYAGNAAVGQTGGAPLPSRTVGGTVSTHNGGAVNTTGGSTVAGSTLRRNGGVGGNGGAGSASGSGATPTYAETAPHMLRRATLDVALARPASTPIYGGGTGGGGGGGSINSAAVGGGGGGGGGVVFITAGNIIVPDGVTTCYIAANGGNGAAGASTTNTGNVAGGGGGGGGGGWVYLLYGNVFGTATNSVNALGGAGGNGGSGTGGASGGKGGTGGSGGTVSLFNLTAGRSAVTSGAAGTAGASNVGGTAGAGGAGGTCVASFVQ